MTEAEQEEIRLLAYLKWERAGYPTNDGVEFWLEAEKELTGTTEVKTVEPNTVQASLQTTPSETSKKPKRVYKR